MKEILRNRKWQLFSLVLATALITSISLNIYQNFSGSNGASNGNPNNEKNTPMNFIFTWGPDTQKIVQGTFVLKIWLTLDGENLTMIIKANDDDYSQWDYIGLVFDTNQNGSIDAGLTGDESYGLFADNYTIPVSQLLNSGYLKFLVYCIELGPHRVSFTDEGYIFTIQFPFRNWNPASLIKNGNNPLHICYYDHDVQKYVFVRFSFFVAEEA